MHKSCFSKSCFNRRSIVTVISAISAYWLAVFTEKDRTGVGSGEWGRGAKGADSSLGSSPLWMTCFWVCVGAVALGGTSSLSIHPGLLQGVWFIPLPCQVRKCFCWAHLSCAPFELGLILCSGASRLLAYPGNIFVYLWQVKCSQNQPWELTVLRHGPCSFRLFF